MKKERLIIHCTSKLKEKLIEQMHDFGMEDLPAFINDILEEWVNKQETEIFVKFPTEKGDLK